MFIYKIQYYCFQDGFTALTIAAKEGYADICQELLAKDAYVNVADRVCCVFIPL